MNTTALVSEAPVAPVAAPVSAPIRRCIVVAESRRVPLSAYVAAWRKARRGPPDAVFSQSLTGLCPATAAEILRQFSFGVHDRINRHIPGFGIGRKWDHDWQRGMIQGAIAVNTPRLIIDWLPPELATRFAYRLRRNRDDLR
jgi:hypothetical protein